MTTCQQEENFFHTLVLGGETDDADYSTSVELVTPDLVCSPKMDPLPVGREQPQAAMLGSKVFYCGGFEYQDISKNISNLQESMRNLYKIMDFQGNYQNFIYVMALLAVLAFLNIFNASQPLQ